jgi:hypothetical protein
MKGNALVRILGGFAAKPQSGIYRQGSSVGSIDRRAAMRSQKRNWLLI